MTPPGPPPRARGTRPRPDPVPPEPPLVDDKPAEEKKPPPRRPRQAPLQARAERFFVKVGDGLEMIGDDYCANIMHTRAEPLAKAWAELAQENPRVNKLLTSSVETGAWGGVALATGVTIVPMLLHHLPPEVLRSLPGPFGALLGGGRGSTGPATPPGPVPPGPARRPAGDPVGQPTQPVPPRPAPAPPPAAVSVPQAAPAPADAPAQQPPPMPDLGVEFPGAETPLVRIPTVGTPNGNPHSGAPGPAAVSR